VSVRGEKVEEGFGDESWIDLMGSGEEKLMGALGSEQILKAAEYEMLGRGRPWFLRLVKSLGLG